MSHFKNLLYLSGSLFLGIAVFGVATPIANADCDWPVSDTEITESQNQIFVFEGVPVTSKGHPRSNAQLIEATKIHKGIVNERQWVYFDFDAEWTEEEGKDYQYGCNAEPGEIGQKQLFVVERIMYNDNPTQKAVKYRVLERHDIVGDSRYTHIVRSIDRAIARNDVPERSKVQKKTPEEMQEELKRVMEVFIQELEVLIAEYKYWNTSR